jgi:hypothetical protein
MLATCLIAVASSVIGCATVTRGTTEVLVIESDPAGAHVRLSTGLEGKTPTSFEVKRRRDLVVTIEKACFETVQVNVNSQVAAAGAAGMAGNVILGGLIGAAVDAGTGATKELKPNPIRVQLNPAPGIECAPVSPTPVPTESVADEVSA